jgi:hypothetical protein
VKAYDAWNILLSRLLFLYAFLRVMVFLEGLWRRSERMKMDSVREKTRVEGPRYA